ncbi:MAG: LicD family protein [Treponema sp.]|nr:LicD family protein [Treponema sp.]
MKVFNTGETDLELKEKYNPEGSKLRRAQLRMLSMMKYIDAICKENGLQYFLTGGNLLGAVRHGGFIPWDDDFDICVPKKDYRKLVKILRDSESEFVLQNHETDRGHVLYWSVLRDTKSEYIKNDVVHMAKKYRGIQIDIFPVSYGVIAFGKKLVNICIRINEKWIKLTKGAKKGLPFIIKELLYYLPKYSLIPFFYLLSLFMPKSILSFSYEAVFKYSFEKKEIFPLSKIPYEDAVFSAPKNTMYFLERHFGENWQNLPSVVERAHHSVTDIIFLEK